MRFMDLIIHIQGEHCSADTGAQFLIARRSLKIYDSHLTCEQSPGMCKVLRHAAKIRTHVNPPASSERRTSEKPTSNEPTNNEQLGTSNNVEENQHESTNIRNRRPNPPTYSERRTSGKDTRNKEQATSKKQQPTHNEQRAIELRSPVTNRRSPSAVRRHPAVRSHGVSEHVHRSLGHFRRSQWSRLAG